MLSPEIIVPTDAVRVIVHRDGSVEAELSDRIEPLAVGQIQLVRFANPEGLSKVGRNLYEATLEAGVPAFAAPGSSGLGSVEQSTLELSNVDPHTERTEFERALHTIRIIRQLLRQT